MEKKISNRIKGGILAAGMAAGLAFGMGSIGTAHAGVACLPLGPGSGACSYGHATNGFQLGGLVVTPPAGGAGQVDGGCGDASAKGIAWALHHVVAAGEVSTGPGCSD